MEDHVEQSVRPSGGQRSDCSRLYAEAREAVVQDGSGFCHH